MRKRVSWGRTPTLVVLAACLGAAALVGQAGPSAGPQAEAGVPLLGGGSRPAAQIDHAVLDARKRTGVTAAAIAIIRPTSIAYSRAVGQRIGARSAPADDRTVFRAASLSKAVFAYLVFTLVGDGRLDLDKPLHEYLSRPLAEYPEYADLAGDTLHRAITARMALSHRTGFPNWRWQSKDRKLRVLFNPGERFLYSGEGYRYLQFVVEQMTGTGLEALAQERVFRPLGMSDTSYEWRDEYARNCAVDREPIEKLFGAGFLKQANCAGSLLTTATDYGRFLAAVLTGRGLPRPLRDEMLRPVTSLAGSVRLFGPAVAATPASGSESGPFWCLGWGGFRSGAGAARFHVGYDSPEFENYTVLYLDKGLGLVVLTAGGQGPASAAPVFVDAVLGPNDTPFGWAGYER
jgi:CubicO group peptidase (beta-lactamase class C family)